MSNLQIGLAAAGGLVLAIMVGHSAWSSRRSRPKQADYLLPADDRHEPSQVGSGIEPELDAAAFELTQFPMVQSEHRPTLDALIDVIAPIAVEEEVSGEAALAAMPTTRRAGGKPFFIEGFNQTERRWESPAAGRRYSSFQAGIQMANRAGALNDIEYSEFVMKAQAFCEAINATPDFPEMREEVARARELDQFATEHDAQLEFLLRAKGAAWSPGYVQQNAAGLGFVAGVIPGRMVIPSSAPGLPPVLGLSFNAQAAMAEDPSQSAIRELAISLDVAQVARSEQPFTRMREVAHRLAQVMEGVVTDDHGVALTPTAMEQIGAELERLYDRLDERDLSAGSAAARRLFS